MKRRIALLAAILAGGLVAPAQAATLRVGSVELRSCGGAWCGTLSRPLDPARPTGAGSTSPSAGTRGRGDGPPLVAVEGGPGYPSTGSTVEYLGIYGPLVPLARPAAGRQPRHGRLGADRLQERAGRSPGARRGGRSRGGSGAARGRSTRATAAGPRGLFATAYAADDLAAVCARCARQGRPLRRLLRHLLRAGLHRPPPGRAALGRARLGLPAARHSTRGTRPRARPRGSRWRRSRRGRWRGWARCWRGSARRRSTGRDAATPTASPLRRARRPARARRHGPGLARRTRSILRELDASVRAALAGDDVPLLRLAGQSNRGTTRPATRPTSRAAPTSPCPASTTRRCPICASRPTPSQPFTGAEWLTISGFSQPYDVCLDWPKPSRRPPRVPVGEAARIGADPDRRRRPRLADAAGRRARVRAGARRERRDRARCATPST